MAKKLATLLLALSMLLLNGCGDGGDAGERQGLFETLADKIALLLPGPGRRSGETRDETQATPTPSPEPVDITPENAELLYCRALLDQEMRQDYDRILYGIEKHWEVITDLKSDSDGLTRIVGYIYADNPQLFWFTGGGMSSTYDAFADGSFAPVYSLSEAKARQDQAVIDARVSAFLSGVPEEASDYDKALAVFEFVVLNTVYDLSLENNSIANVLVRGTGICGCYSKTTQYLLNLLGVQCVTVSGTSTDVLGTQNHAWNLVRLDGEWYWLDSTWGDPMSTDGLTQERIDYGYFCVTTEMIRGDHAVDDSFPVPDCTATACNYYVHNGLLLEGYDYYAVRDIFYAAAEAGAREARMRFTGYEAYNEALYDLLTNEKVFQIYYDSWGSTQCSCYRDDRLYTLSFILP